MTACRRHVLEQGFGPQAKGASTWWPLSVVSGLAQASYTVQRIEGQATSRTKKNKQTKQKQKKTKIWPNIAVGRLVVKSLFFCFYWFGWFLCFLFGKFRKFSEMVDF